MDTNDLIDLVRREHGVVLDQSDPVLAVATVARAVSEEGRVEVREMLAEMRRVAAEISRVGILSTESETKLLDRVAVAVPPAVQRALTLWHSWIDRREARKAAAVVFVAFLAGYGACWLRTPVVEVSHWYEHPPQPYQPSDAAGLAAHCKANTFDLDGRKGCHQGDVWLDPAPVVKTK